MWFQSNQWLLLFQCSPDQRRWTEFSQWELGWRPETVVSTTVSWQLFQKVPLDHWQKGRLFSLLLTCDFQSGPQWDSDRATNAVYLSSVNETKRPDASCPNVETLLPAHGGGGWGIKPNGGTTLLSDSARREASMKCPSALRSSVEKDGLTQAGALLSAEQKPDTLLLPYSLYTELFRARGTSCLRVMK